jgi:hypothetical protein
MDESNDAVWFAFEALAKACPHDDGVRLTADLARWLLEERQRQQLSAPPILQKVVHSLTEGPAGAGPSSRSMAPGPQ